MLRCGVGSCLRVSDDDREGTVLLLLLLLLRPIEVVCNH